VRTYLPRLRVLEVVMMGLLALFAPSASCFYDTVVSFNITGLVINLGPKHPNHYKHQQKKFYKFFYSVQVEYHFFHICSCMNGANYLSKLYNGCHFIDSSSNQGVVIRIKKGERFPHCFFSEWVSILCNKVILSNPEDDLHD
jgi:hypothetical protein